MKISSRLSGFALLTLIAFTAFAAECEKPNPDWPNLTAYRDKNAALGAPLAGQARVVFMGDSITEFWDKKHTDFFATPGFINRGISGQTSPQMLIRFRPDVIALKPSVVVILAGTNDVAGNTGPATTRMIADNIASMAELAKQHGIAVVLASVLPASRFYWAPEQRPASQIVELNAWIKTYAQAQGHGYIDYHTPMADKEQGLKTLYSDDGVHPNASGYALMNALVLDQLRPLLRVPDTTEKK